MPTLGLQLRSLITSGGELQLSLVTVPTAAPAPHEVVVRVDATPINPSDLGLLFGAADMTTARRSGTHAVTARVPDAAMRSMAGRLDQSMPVGNEGAGVVIEAGASAPAQALLGKTVAVLGGAMYSQYRTVPVAACMLLPDGVSAAEGASAFVNPLTVLGMIETMRNEGHHALVHTVGVSNVGLMLNRVCLEDGIGLVNVVRKHEQVQQLTALGARHVCNSSSPAFLQELGAAIAATGATIAFDAIGGGRMASQILSCMEAALSATASQYSRYGSSTHKQVYIYGSLDPSPTELVRNFGLAWGIAGWLVTPFLAKAGPERTEALKQRVAAGIKTTFASQYSNQVSLAGALDLDAIAAYGKRATGDKYLIVPSLDPPVG
jgi:NADPH2:quinone reductase